MRVQIVDPPAYTPPYDRSLSAALARSGGRRRARHEPFRWGSVPDPEGYEVHESFYRRAAAAGPYSWDAIAEQHLALYRQLSSG